MNDQNFVLWPIDENMGTNLRAFYKHFYIGCLKTQKQQLHFVKIKNNFFKLHFFVFNSGRVRVNQAGRKPVRAGHSALGPMMHTLILILSLVYTHTRVNCKDMICIIN